MEILQFISAIVASLAWPGTILTIFFILKKPLKEAVLSLAKVKYKDIEIEFDRLKKVGEHLPKPIKIKEIPQSERIFYSSLEKQVHDIAPTSPESAILICWATLEVALSEAVARLGISTTQQSARSIQQNLASLKTYSKLDDNSFMTIHALRDLRNRIAHGSRADVEQALTFGKITTKIIETLQNVEGN